MCEPESGARAAEVCPRHGVRKETLRHWRAEYGGMELQNAKRLKAPEEENRRLMRLVAEQSLDLSLLKDVVERKW